jgi:hypothetical protein
MGDHKITGHDGNITVGREDITGDYEDMMSDHDILTGVLSQI